jgi:hypothetical protein
MEERVFPVRTFSPLLLLHKRENGNPSREKRICAKDLLLENLLITGNHGEMTG